MVSKHAGTSEAWIDLWHTDARLRHAVTDNGHGGATRAGTGLQGIERRLAAFDGVLGIAASPAA